MYIARTPKLSFFSSNADQLGLTTPTLTVIGNGLPYEILLEETLNRQLPVKVIGIGASERQKKHDGHSVEWHENLTVSALSVKQNGFALRCNRKQSIATHFVILAFENLPAYEDISQIEHPLLQNLLGQSMATANDSRSGLAINTQFQLQGKHRLQKQLFAYGPVTQATLANEFSPSILKADANNLLTHLATCISVLNIASP